MILMNKKKIYKSILPFLAGILFIITYVRRKEAIYLILGITWLTIGAMTIKNDSKPQK